MLLDGLHGKHINLMGRADSIRAWLEQRMQHSNEVVFVLVATPSAQKIFAKNQNSQTSEPWGSLSLSLCGETSNLCRAEPAPFALLMLGVSP